MEIRSAEFPREIEISTSVTTEDVLLHSVHRMSLRSEDCGRCISKPLLRLTKLLHRQPERGSHESVLVPVLKACLYSMSDLCGRAFFASEDTSKRHLTNSGCLSGGMTRVNLLGEMTLNLRLFEDIEIR